MPWPSSTRAAGARSPPAHRTRCGSSPARSSRRCVTRCCWPRTSATLDLLSEGRLVVLPTVSAGTRDEYAALGVPFEQRGAILDEQLEVLEPCWRTWPGQPPRALVHLRRGVARAAAVAAPTGAVLWFGGQGMHRALLRRIVRYGNGFNPFGSPAPTTTSRRCATALVDAGRDPDGMELVGGIRGPVPGRRTPALTSTRRSRPLPGPAGRRASRRSASSRRCSSTTGGRGRRVLPRTGAQGGGDGRHERRERPDPSRCSSPVPAAASAPRSP